MKTSLTLLTILLTSIVGCNKQSTASSDANSGAAGSGIIVSGGFQVALGGQTQITATGGTGVYIYYKASQGALAPSSSVTGSAWTYTAPTTATDSTVTIYITDSAGAQGQWTLSLTGVTPTTGTGSTFTSTSCGGTFNITDGRASGQLLIVQNANNQISGYLSFPSLNWTYPISGTCAVTAGATSGTISFQNVALQDSYTGSLTLNGGAPTFRGNVTFTDTRTNTTWTANSTVLSAPPVAETQSCGGTYNASFGTAPNVQISASNPGSAGQLVLVHNGAGIVAGYQVRSLNGQSVVYSMSGTCGNTVSLRNNTNGTTYSGTGVFNGATATLGGQFVTRTTSVSPSATYYWSASK